jgi:hypothetical protein
MHLFGAMGSLMFIIGFIMGYIGVSKLYHMFMNMRYSLVTNNPWFYCLNHHGNRYSVILAGFLGEIILRTKSNEERYKISSEVNL